jgi:hypothetical protein
VWNCAGLSDLCQSLGWRNTKIRAAADTKGRLLSTLLIGARFTIVRLAQRLIQRTTRAKALLAGKVA